MFSIFATMRRSWQPALFFLMICMSCNRDNGQAYRQEAEYPEAAVKEQFVRANQQQVQKENDEIAWYIKTHGLPFITTASGIRYFVYKPSAKGDSVRDQMEITIDYTVSLLNGTVVYSSAVDGKKTFVVGNGDVESGIHKGIKYLKRGDKALLILPSALAHGLLGDMKKIPPQMPIVYDIKVH